MNPGPYSEIKSGNQRQLYEVAKMGITSLMFNVKMGSKPSKSLSTVNCPFTTEEQKNLRRIFSEINQGNPFTYTNLKAYLEKSLSNKFVVGFYDLICFHQKEWKSGFVEFSDFVNVIYKILKRPPTELATMFMFLISRVHGSENVSCIDIFTFVDSVTKECLNIICKEKEFKFWNEKLTDPDGDQLSRFLLKELIYPDGKNKDVVTNLPETSYTVTDIATWLSKTSLVIQIWDYIYYHCFPVAKYVNLFPCYLNSKPLQQTILDLANVIALNHYLPIEAKSEWKQLYNSLEDGESFNVMVNQILQKGKTLVVIKDRGGHVFGGFASKPWQMNAAFQGSVECFVFSLEPVLNIYQATGFNNHFMYLNQNQQTLPNGLGFGGQFDYFGIWLDSDFGKGYCSPSCVTYNCDQLSFSPSFHTEVVEVWQVGPATTEELEQDTRSVLDKDPAAEAMLEMIGRGPVSKGLRTESSKSSKSSKSSNIN